MLQEDYECSFDNVRILELLDIMYSIRESVKQSEYKTLGRALDPRANGT